MRRLLLPFSFVYWLGVTIRNWFFEIGVLKTSKVGVPVISVGNISTGGTGKTPIVEILIEKLISSGQLAVVSRGYRRKSSGTIVVSNGAGNFSTVEDAGDEAIQLATKYLNLIVVVDEKRVRGAHKAVELGANLILLDDGFQHRYLHRDLNIVVLAVEDILKGDSLLPVGNKREPMNSLKRSDLIIISRCENEESYTKAMNKIISFGKPILGTQTKLKSFINASTKQKIEEGLIKNKTAIVFSGIGNPKSLDSLLSELKVNAAKHLVFPDHHWYSDADVKRIIETRKSLKADMIITTEKDAARLEKLYNHYLTLENLIIAEIQQRIIAGEEELRTMVNQLLAHVPKYK